MLINFSLTIEVFFSKNKKHYDYINEISGASTFQKSENRGFKGNGSLQRVLEREVEDAILQRGYRHYLLGKMVGCRGKFGNSNQNIVIIVT